MAASKAATVEAYLDELPTERREVIAAVRERILERLPTGYEERMNWGVICYELPLLRYRNTYNKQPLAVAGLSAQKNYFAVYLFCIGESAERNAWLAAEFAKAGKKLDMGKCCVRFRSLANLALEPILQLIEQTTPERLIQEYEVVRRR